MATLVVVAQRARARLFLHRGLGEPLVEVEDLVHPESRLHGTSLDTDRPGRVHDRHGPGRHSMANEETSKERAASDFSREVAAAIRKRRVDGEAHRVVLMAEPGFLGLLRGALDGPTKKIVDAEVPKEVTGRKVEEIAGYLEGIVRVGSGRG